MSHWRILTTRMLACSDIYQGITHKLNGMQATYGREGALSQYLSKFEVLWPLLAWLRGLDGRLCPELWALAGRLSRGTGLWRWALHAGTVAATCAWDSKWRAGVGVISYHWWMWAGTDDNAGLNGHNIILEREAAREDISVMSLSRITFAILLKKIKK